MKTWQAVLLHLGLVSAAAAAPTVKNDTAKAVLFAVAGTGTVMGAMSNSKTDPKGKKLKPTVDGFTSKEK